MAKKKGLWSTIAEGYLFKYPQITSNTALARLMLKENTDVYKDVEDARAAIRKTQGLLGKASLIKANIDFKNRLNQFREECNIEYSEKDQWVNPIIKENKALVISDIHLGKENWDAIDLALEYGYTHNMEAIIINGDLFEFGALTKWGVDERAKTVEWEIEQGGYFFDFLQKAFPDVKIYFHGGNHDMYVQRYIMQNADKLKKLPSFRLQNLLELERRKIQWVDDRAYMEFGKLKITHGHHIVRGIFPPVNVARGVYLKTNESVLIGHCHKTSTHIETKMSGETIGCFSMGCMSDLAPSWNPQVSKWNLGFAFVSKDEQGNFEVENKMIINEKVL
jgi:predicted phosphodiesterase